MEHVAIMMECIFKWMEYGNPNFRNSNGIVQRCGGQFQGTTTYNSITFGMI